MMIQNLRIVFSRTDILFLSILIISIFIMLYKVKEVDCKLGLKIAACCIFVWIFLVFSNPPHGFNYNIYQYNAQLTLEHQQSFGRESTTGNQPYGISFKNEKYLDYTGAQHLVYVLLESLNLEKVNKSLYGLGFQLWMILLFAFIVFLTVSLDNSINEKWDVNKIWPALILTLSPVIPFFLLIRSWEDKLTFLLFPLIIYFFINKKYFKTSSFLLGVFAAFNGILVFFIPVYLIFLIRNVKEGLLINLLLVLLGIIVAFIPFFPESISGWLNRFNRTNMEKTTWYSIYFFLPDTWYSPFLNKLLILLSSLSLIFFYYIKKLSLKDSLIIAVGIVILLSPYNGIARILPYLILVSVFTPQMKYINWLILVIFLFTYFLIDNGFSPPVINMQNLILFHIPVLLVIFIYIFKRKNLKINFD